MAAIHVQAASAVVSATTQILALGSNVVAGNSIIVGIRAQNATVTVSSVTDSLGNTYTLSAGPIRGALDGMSFWQYHADNIAGGACSVTVVLSGSANRGLELHEVSGLDTAGSFDATANVTNGSGTPSVGSVTPSVADGFALAMETTNGGNATAGSGWTGYAPGNSYWYDYSEYRIITSTSSVTGLFATASGAYDGLIVTYKAAAGGGGGSTSDVIGVLRRRRMNQSILVR